MSETAETLAPAQAEKKRESPGEGDPGFLWDFWYPALRSAEIRGQKLAKAMLLEIPLVLGRTREGKAFAMRDSCPHRGIPLSYGRFDGTTVECSYHGWRFDACSGRCVEIPSDKPGQAESRADFRGPFSLPGTRRLRLGVHERAWHAAAGDDSAGAGASDFQRKIQNHAPELRAAFPY